MTDIYSRIVISNESLPKVTGILSLLDGKGRNELVRMLMRLCLQGISYSLPHNEYDSNIVLRLSVSQTSHPDLYEHLSNFPSKLRASEVHRMLLVMEEGNSIYAGYNNASVTKTVEEHSKSEIEDDVLSEEPHEDDRDSGIVINDDDLRLADML